MALNIQSQMHRMLQAARLSAQHHLRVQRHGERASSGLRINRASDDAAGLSIAEALRTQSRGSLTAAKNIQDGLSLLNVTDAAVSQITDALHRMRQLAVQASNGVWTAQERQIMEQEFLQLRSEINYVTLEANFNGFYLLRGGEPSGFTVEGPRTVSETTSAGLSAVTVTPASQTFGAGSALPVTLGGLPEVYGLGVPGPQSIVVDLRDTVTGVTRSIAYDPVNGFDYNGGGNSINLNGTALPTPTEAITVRYIPANSLTVPIPTTTVPGSASLTANGVPMPNAGAPGGNGYYESGTTVSIEGNSRPDAGAGAVTYRASYHTGDNEIPLDLETVEFEGGITDPTRVNVTVNGVPVAYDPANGFDLIASPVEPVGATTVLNAYKVTLNGASQLSGPGPHTIQVTYDFDRPTGVDPLNFEIQDGPNNGQTNTLSIDRLTVGGMQLGNAHIRTQSEAMSMLGRLNSLPQTLNQMRARIGSYQSSLQHVYNNVLYGGQQMAASESHIRDADMANEVTEATRAQILRQGAFGMVTAIRNDSNYLVQLINNGQ